MRGLRKTHEITYEKYIEWKLNYIVKEGKNMKQIIKIDLRKIDSFKEHPFRVENDESLKELRNSIKENGLLNPLVVRKKENERFEMISGHRRKLALELNGIMEADCYTEELNDDEATIYMVDSNIYRNKILPSEKAFAYKMKLEAIKHQGKKKTLLHNLCRS